METNSILTANILDILFEGRNKEYGAYDLRNTYNKRINTALGITAIAIVIAILAISWKNGDSGKSTAPIIVDATLTTPPPEEKIIPPILRIIKPQIKTAAFPPPVIVMDRLVTEPPVENDKLADAIIDVRNRDGDKYEGIIPPEEIKNSNIIEVPVKKGDTDDDIFKSVEIEARFNGNWNAYLQKEIEKNMDELTEAGESGTCIVKFVVSIDGSVSDVEAITMKGTKLAEISVNAIRKGPKWIPAKQNGTIVNAYRHQPVTFKITD